MTDRRTNRLRQGYGRPPELHAKAEGLRHKRTTGVLRNLVTAGLAVFIPMILHGQVQMPNLSEMSGVALPSSDLPDRTVSVRVIRGALSNNIPGQKVVLVEGSSRRTATTDDTGRARFDGLTPGSRVRATTSVDGETIESQEFAVPAQGGIRVMLVAGLGAPAAAVPDAPAGPPQPGMVILGPQTRFVIEVSESALQVFGLIEIRNNARVPVTTAPLVFDMPPGARQTTVLQGSSPQAKAEGQRVKVTGPFQPGATQLQFAYELPYSGSSVKFAQKLPASLEQLAIAAQQVGDLRLESPQIDRHGHQSADGQTYIVASGPAIAAGGVLTLELLGLPHHGTWLRDITLALATLILIAGALAAWVRPGRTTQVDTATLAARKEALLSELVSLEERRRAGRIDEPGFRNRSGQLVEQLERVYAALDGAHAARPAPSGGKAIAHSA